MKSLLQKTRIYWMENVGRRGTSLVVFACLLMLSAYQYVFYQPTWRLLDNLHYPLSIMPLQGWGILFFVAAVLGIVGAFRKKAETLAFNVLAAVNAVWATFYLLGSMTGYDHGGLTRIIFHLLCAGFILLLAGWAEVRFKDK